MIRQAGAWPIVTVMLIGGALAAHGWVTSASMQRLNTHIDVVERAQMIRDDVESRVQAREAFRTDDPSTLEAYQEFARRIESHLAGASASASEILVPAVQRLDSLNNLIFVTDQQAMQPIGEGIVAQPGSQTPDVSAVDLAGEFESTLSDYVELSEASISDVPASERMAVPVILILLLISVTCSWVRAVRLHRQAMTRQSAALKSLQQAQRHKAAIIEAIPDIIFLHERDGTFVDVSESKFDSLLIHPKDFLGKRIEDVLPPEIAVPGAKAIRAAVETGKQQYLEYELDVDGRAGEFEARFIPVDSDRVLAMVRNVSDERKSERARLEAEARFRSLVEHSFIGIYMIQDGNFIYANPQLGRIMGFSTDEIIGKKIEDFCHPDDRAIVRENLRRRLDGEVDHVRYSLRVPSATGGFVTVEVYGSTTTIEGQTAIIGTMHDITEREKQRKEIADLKAFYEETLNRLPIEIAVLDSKARYVYVNPLTARSPEKRQALLGSTLEEYCRANDLKDELFARRQRWVEQVVETGEGSSLEEVVHSSNGPDRHILRVAAPVHDEEGKVKYVVGYALDVSDRKQYEKKLLDAKERAEELAQLKSAFLANMSHEIRTPLTGILGFASVLEDEVPPEQQHFASLIVRSGKRLLDTLNAVLDLSRLEAGEMKLEIKPVNLGSEVNEIISFLRSLAVEKGISLEMNEPENPVKGMVDAGALHIVLNNLVGNAIKFTDDGFVRVEVAPKGHRCCVRIVDTGVGIDEAFIPQIFDEFKQESIGLARSHEGAGLGLAITRKLIAMMDGTIEVFSRKGEGTTFEITFPRAPDQLDLPLNDVASSESPNVLS